MLAQLRTHTRHEHETKPKQISRLGSDEASFPPISDYALPPAAIKASLVGRKDLVVADLGMSIPINWLHGPLDSLVEQWALWQLSLVAAQKKISVYSSLGQYNVTMCF